MSTHSHVNGGCEGGTLFSRRWRCQELVIGFLQVFGLKFLFWLADGVGVFVLCAGIPVLDINETVRI